MKLLKILFIATSFLLASCAGFEQIVLFQGKNHKPVGTPALAYEKGNLTELKWNGVSPDVVSVNDGQISLKKDNTKSGNRNSYLYLDVDNVDFRGDLAVVIQAKVIDGDEAKLRLELIDDKGHIANGKDLTNVIKATDDFVEYTYKTEGSFTQLVPELADVNSANIKTVRFVFAPASKTHKGTLVLGDVKVKVGTEASKKRNLGPKGKDGGLIADFSKGVKGWSTRGTGIEVSKDKGAMKLDASAVGPAYQAVVSKVDLIDLSNKSVIKVRVNVEGNEKPFLRLDVQDINGNVSNKFPKWLKLDGVSNYKNIATSEGEGKINDDGVFVQPEIDLNAGRNYVDYYFDLSGRFAQSYPTTSTLDEKRINKVILYLNPGYNRYTGKVYIESIEAI